MGNQPGNERALLTALIREALAVADATGELIAGCHLAAALDGLLDEGSLRAECQRTGTDPI